MSEHDLGDEYIAGYRDGRDPSCPVPSDNRHPAYRHSFAVGRAELSKKPIHAELSRKRAAMIDAQFDPFPVAPAVREAWNKLHPPSQP